MANILEFVIRAKDEASSQLQGINISLGGVLETALGFSLANVGGMVADEMREMVSTAAELEGVSNAFRNLAEDAGRNADDFIAELKEMSGGLMTEGEIMKMTNQAILLGGKELADQLPLFMKVSQAAARATGQSFDYMFNSIITGTARGSKLILDNLGIMVDWQKAYDDYAESLGKTAQNLTEAEKAQARYNEVGRAAEEHIERMGEAEETTAEKMTQLSTKVKELKTDIGEKLLPVLDRGADGLLAITDGMDMASDAAGEWLNKQIEGANSAEEYARNVHLAAGELDWYTRTYLSLSGALDIAALKQRYMAQATEEAKESTEEATSATWEMGEALGITAEKAAEYEKQLEKNKKAIEEWVRAQEEEKAMHPEAWYLTQAEAMDNLEVALKETTDARIIGAQNAAAAERTAYEDSLAAAEADAEAKGAIWEDAKQRLDETKAGLHGVAGAYDELAITTEGAEPFKIAYEQAKENVANIKKEWEGLAPVLQTALTTAIENTADPVLKRWQQFEEDQKEAEEIKNKALMESLAETLPTLEQMLATYVQDSIIALDDLPREFQNDVYNMLFDWGETGPKMAAEADLWKSHLDEPMAGVSKTIKTGLEDPIDDAMDKFDDFTKGFTAFDGERIDVHIYEHIHRIDETGGASHQDFYP